MLSLMSLSQVAYVQAFLCVRLYLELSMIPSMHCLVYLLSILYPTNRPSFCRLRFFSNEKLLNAELYLVTVRLPSLTPYEFLRFHVRQRKPQYFAQFLYIVFTGKPSGKIILLMRPDLSDINLCQLSKFHAYTSFRQRIESKAQ